MDVVQQRLAKVDAEADEWAGELEDARQKWMAEKDPAFKAVLKIVYDEYVSREKRINARIAALEAKLPGPANGGGADPGNKRPRMEDYLFPPPPSGFFGHTSPLDDITMGLRRESYRRGDL